jgi:hypothetical protein
MQSVEFWHAVWLWWHGNKVDEMALWGVVPMLWVGRAGKIVAFVASVVAVIDIIGPDNIEKWSERMRRDPKKRSIWTRIVNFYVYSRWGWLIVSVLILATLSGIAFLMTPYMGFAFEAFPGIPGLLADAALGGVIGLVGLVVIGWLLLRVVRFIDWGIAAVAHLLTRDGWERPLRWSSFVLLIVGFALDLLTS